MKRTPGTNEKSRPDHFRLTRGQSLVEFALAIPIFVLLVLATLDFARAVAIGTTLANAARDGARYGSIAPTDTVGIINAAQKNLVLPRPGSVSVTRSFPNGSSTSGNPVQVTVTYQLHFLTSAVTGIGSAGVTLTAQSTMMIE